MPKKSCKHCGIVPMNHVCPVALREKNAQDAKREDKQIYWDKRWIKLRADVLEYQKHVCLWSLYVEGVIREANVGHHIVTIIDDVSKAYDVENVIGLESETHDRIHKLYKTDKKAVIDILHECMKLCDHGIKLEDMGVLKNRLSSIK